MQLDSNHPTIAALIAHQERLHLSDAKFAAARLQCAASTWLRVKSGSYQVDDQTQILQRLDGALAALDDEAASPAAAASARVLPLASVRSVTAAVRAALGEPRDRLVVALAPTGGGKTSVAKALLDTYPGRVALVEATEPWRKSYLAACEAIGAAVGMREIPSATRAAESALLAHLARAPRVIVIDEAHYLGPQTANLAKAILNRTPCVVVLLAIPALWARTRRQAWEEAEQLRSRTCALLQLDQVQRADIDALLADRLPAPSWAEASPPQRPQILEIIAKAANSFGLLDTVERIAREILHELGADPAPLTLDITTAAVRRIQALRA